MPLCMALYVNLGSQNLFSVLLRRYMFHNSLCVINQLYLLHDVKPFYQFILLFIKNGVDKCLRFLLKT